ncbi:MAG: N-acetyl-gamma-glutamyl-phosphate reductase [Desulfobacterales bacterium]
MKRIAVIGATGYTGAELIRILAGHPHVEISVLTSRQHAGKGIHRIYPAFHGVVELTCEAYDPITVASRCDLAFLALPHRLPMTIAPELLDRGVKVIDLSADFRFSKPEDYAAAYEPHSSPSYLERAVYGLSEIYSDAIRTADLVGNPGCYPTSVLLPLAPIVRKGLLDLRSLIADAKSGVSGAGRSPALGSLFCEVQESFKAYKVAEHRHNPEMNQILTREAGQPVSITFVPHLVPMSRGMLTTIYAAPQRGVGREDVLETLAEAYRDRPFVRIHRDAVLPETRNVRGTNYCDIAVRQDADSNRLILVSAIDNLVKGASGQAVQNMNLMLALDEAAGLSGIPFPL